MAQHSLRRDFLLAPITALAFYTSTSGQRYLLVGEGSEIKVYEANTPHTGSLCCQFPIFSVQSIHGIRVRPAPSSGGGDATVLVWGNQNLAVLPGRIIEDRLSGDALPPPRVSEARAPDWIFDGILAAEDDGRCFLVTAHNEVLEVTWGGQAQQRDPYALRFGRVIFPARPALYSARIAWASTNEVLVAGGTVFGEIVVWRCGVEGAGAPAPEVLFVFTGHEGSIFGVDFSPELELPDGSRGRLLASCSDDRTIRIWDVSSSAARGVTLGHGFYEARETGFVGIDAALSAVQDRTGASVAVAMGHVSRIWGVRFGSPLTLGDPTKLGMAVYTFGEDSTVWKWELNIDGKDWKQRTEQGEAPDATVAGEIAKLTHMETFSNHDGKHIWSSDLDHLEDGRSTAIATGGADGRVNIITDVHSRRVASATTTEHTATLPRQFQTVVVKNILDQVSTSGQHARRKKVTLHQFVYLAHDQLLGVSNSGQLVLGTTDPELTWKDIPLNGIDPSCLSACSVMQTPAPGVVLLGTAQKKVYLYRDEKIQELGTLSGKVADLFVVDPVRPGDSQYHQQDGGYPTSFSFVVVLIGAPDAMQLVTVDLDTTTIASVITIPDQEPNYIATSARLLGHDILAIGSRHGHLTLFQRTPAGLTTITQVDRRTADTITSITPLPNQAQPSPESNFLFLATCRDGYYRLYEFKPTEEAKSTLTLLHETASTAIVNVEYAWFTAPTYPNGSQDLILVGFRGKCFVVYNATLRLDLAAIDCSGGHRSFSYRPLSASDPSKLRFAFNRASDLGVYVQQTANYVTLNPGTHGREIRAVAPGGKWIATGSEDTVVRLWEYDDGSRGIDRAARCVASMKLHRAGLQAIKWATSKGRGARDEKMLFSCAGNEEFIVWRVQEVKGAGGVFPGPAVLKEAVFTDKTPDGDLRIMDFDVAAADNGDEGFACLISMAFSNSTVKTYRYSSARGFRLVAKGRYTGACIMKLQLLRDLDGLLELMTASSDGRIAIWGAQLSLDAPEDVVDYAPELVIPLHQSSIKGFGLRHDALVGEGGRYLIVTGGDDNSLVVTALLRTVSGGRLSYALLSKHGVKSAHAAAINGIAILPRHGSGTVDVTTIATISNDQRFKVWRIQETTDGNVKISLLGDRNSAVADPADLDILSTSDERTARIMVVGVGMEVWRFDHGRPASLSRDT